MDTLPNPTPRFAGEFLDQQKDQVSWDKNLNVMLKECLSPSSLAGFGLGICFPEGLEISPLENSNVSLHFSLYNLTW